MKVMPKTLAFGFHKVGVPSKVKIVNVINPAANQQSITLGNMTTSGGEFGFDPSTTTCVNGAALQSGNRCKIGIIFTAS